MHAERRAYTAWKLTEAQKAEVTRQYTLGRRRLVVIAKAFGISQSAVCKIAFYRGAERRQGPRMKANGS